MTGSLRERLALVVITDPECAGRSVVEVVAAALDGGAGTVQLRAKHATTREMVELARRLREETRRAGALLFVNDRLDVALAAAADGVHLGDDDMPLGAARSLAPPGFLIGRSVDGVEGARAAERDGADYLGVGPIFSTPSKADAGVAIGLPGLRAVRDASPLPLVAIGGIGLDNAAGVIAAGADGVAVIRAVMQAAEPAEAARALLRLLA